MPQTIDLTPTWAGLVPGIIGVLEREMESEDWQDWNQLDPQDHGYAEAQMRKQVEAENLRAAKQTMREEVARMAKGADLYNKWVEERNLDTIQKVNDELTDLAARMEDAEGDDGISSEHQCAITEAKYEVQSAMSTTDFSG